MYLWVDGSDPEFAEQLRGWSETACIAGPAVKRGRFTDNDELKHSLRSLDRFAPWAGFVHIVTNGQVPRWLNVEHPRVRVVFHCEIFARESDLPTFNSTAIEWQLHRVPGLSEQFLYLNDDFFLGQPVTAADFLTAGGGQKIYVEKESVPLERCTDHFRTASTNAMRALKPFFQSPQALQLPAHTPRLLQRSVLAELEQVLDRDVQRTTASRFRSDEDSLMLAAYAGWLLAKHSGVNEVVVLPEPSDMYRFLRLDGAWWWWARSFMEMSRKTPKFYCINDDFEPGVLAWIGRVTLKIFFQVVLGRRSPYERE